MRRLPLRSRVAAVLAIPSFVLSFSACEGSCRVSTASLSELRVASLVDPESHEPVATTTTFAPDAPSVFVTALVSYAPEGTRVRAVFFYLEEGEREIASDEVPVSGSRYVSFELTAPDAGWPLGRYEVRFFLDGDEHDERLEFRVVDAMLGAPSDPGGSGALGPPTATGAGTSSQQQRFADEDFGFEVLFPEGWQWRAVDRSYLIEGPPGTPAYELSFVIQFVLRSANPGSSADLQLEEAEDSVLQAPDAEIRGRDTATVGGEYAPYFVASYTATDSQGRSGPFGHMHFVVDHGDYYWWLTYTGPADTYREYGPVIERALETFRFTR